MFPQPGSRQQEPPEPRKHACHYDSCPKAQYLHYNFNATRPELNWVNSFPVTAVKYGIDRFVPEIWGEGEENMPELVVSGPNVGSNLALQVTMSGTIGAAAWATRERRIPAIAFSGDDKEYQAWHEPPSVTSLIYARLSAYLTNKLIESGKPYLPENTILSVNLPDVENCYAISDYKFVLSRVNPWQSWAGKDVEWCGDDSLPWEVNVAKKKCHVSISPIDATDILKSTQNDRAKQAFVLDKLKDVLSCYRKDKDEEKDDEEKTEEVLEQESKERREKWRKIKAGTEDELDWPVWKKIMPDMLERANVTGVTAPGLEVVLAPVP